MEDNNTGKSNVGPVDEHIVNVLNEQELKYWADKFRVSKAAVIRAVGIVGVKAKDVNEFLNGRVA